MKKSSEWTRQPGLDKKLDQLVEDRGCTPAELVPYDAAKMLDIEPSGEFYKKVRDWKQRRAAAEDVPFMEVPPHVQAAFREAVDRFTAEAMSSFLRAVSGVGGDLNRVASLRVADAERRANDAQAEANSLLDNWTNAEEQRDAALAKVVELERALSDARREAEVTAVRLEERDALIQALMPVSLDKGSPMITPSVSNADRPLAHNVVDHQVDDVAINASTVPADAPVGDMLKQPLGINTDHNANGQVEMPLVVDEPADHADGGEGRQG